MTTFSRLACLAALAAAAPLPAQDVITTETTTTTTTQAAPQLRRVTQILGSNVMLQGGSAYGKVEDIVLNDAGSVEYIVASNDGRMVMLPWDAGNYDYGKRVVTYDVAPQSVQPLSFAPDAWPTMANDQYTTRVRQVFPRGVRARGVPGVGIPADADKVKIKEKDGKTKIKVKDRD